MKKAARYVSPTLLCFLVMTLSSCQKSQAPAAEVKKAPDQRGTSSNPAPKAPSTAGPGVAELREVIKRVYKDAVVVDENRSNSVVGDFNDDNSEDIAIVVMPNDRALTEINGEYPNWILEDPVRVGELVGANGQPRAREEPHPTIVQSGDTLLAVVHGYQQAGWRSAQAKQTYLLKNAVGDKLQMQHARLLFHEAANHKNLPQLHGDIIRATLANKQGFLYWTGAKYAWHQLV